MTMAGRVTFSEENVKTSNTDFPKLKLEQVGGYARIVCMEDPVMAWRHQLNKVKIINGRPQPKPQDSTERGDWVMDFVGQPLCLGNEGILEERGSDPQHCPACAESQRSDMVPGPTRRYAMHVIKYQTKPGSAEIALPFQVQCVVWGFTDRMFSKLVSIRKEVLPDQLMQHDLTLGPLQAPVNFQKFDISVSMRAEWLMRGDEGRDLAWATFQQQQTPDLEATIGRKVKPSYMEEDIQAIRDSWQAVHGLGAQPQYDPSVPGLGLAAGLTGLLDGALGGQALPSQAAAPVAEVAATPQYVAPPTFEVPVAAPQYAAVPLPQPTEPQQVFTPPPVPAAAPVAAPGILPQEFTPPPVAAPQPQVYAQMGVPVAPPAAMIPPSVVAPPSVPLPQFTPPPVAPVAAAPVAVPLAPQPVPAVTMPNLGEVGAAPAAPANFAPGQVSSFDELLAGVVPPAPPA